MYEERLDGHVNAEALKQLDDKGITRKLKRTKPFQLVGIKLRAQKRGASFLRGHLMKVSPLSANGMRPCVIHSTLRLLNYFNKQFTKKLLVRLGPYKIIRENKNPTHHEVKLF